MSSPWGLLADGFRIITALGNIAEHSYNLASGDSRDVELALADLGSITADLGVTAKWVGKYKFAALGGAELIASAITVVELLEQTTGLATPADGWGLRKSAGEFS
ncbi:hypothetical protein, partial [Mycobacterium sp. 050134]|uniref:hypothetical protein n=1 Tax=Mycobacterium sp. 050134 TaxID=3096111 RepID=UPI002ED7CC95